MTDIRIDRPEEAKTHKTQQKKYYKSKYCVSLHLPKELEEKALEQEKVQALIAGKNVVKVICVPQKLVNIVVK